MRISGEKCNLILRVMFHSKLGAIYFSMSWEIALIEFWMPLAWSFGETISPFWTRCRVCSRSVLGTSLSSRYSFLCYLPFLSRTQSLFERNNNIWRQGQPCQSLSCKITPGLTLNCRGQVCRIIWSKTKTKAKRLIFQMGLFGQQAFMEHCMKPSLCQVPENTAIICKELAAW